MDWLIGGGGVEDDRNGIGPFFFPLSWNTVDLQICVGGGIPSVKRHKSQDHEQSKNADWKQKQQKWRRWQWWKYERKQQQWRRQANQQKQSLEAQITGAAGEHLFALLGQWPPVFCSPPFRCSIHHLFHRESISSSSGTSTPATSNSIDTVPSSRCRYIHETAGRILMMMSRMVMVLEESQVSCSLRRPPSLFNTTHFQHPTLPIQ